MGLLGRGEVDEQSISAGFELHHVWVPSLDVILDSPSMLLTRQPEVTT
jgi:hypothetical protein